MPCVSSLHWASAAARVLVPGLPASQAPAAQPLRTGRAPVCCCPQPPFPLWEGTPARLHARRAARAAPTLRAAAAARLSIRPPWRPLPRTRSPQLPAHSHLPLRSRSQSSGPSGRLPLLTFLWTQKCGPGSPLVALGGATDSWLRSEEFRLFPPHRELAQIFSGPSPAGCRAPLRRCSE